MSPALTTAAPKTQITANLICMVSMLIWAAGLPAASVLIPLLPPLPLSTARVTLAALALLPVWLLVEGPAALIRANWGKGVLVGSSLGLGALLMILGQTRTDAVTVAVISAAMPVVGVALEVLLDGRRITAALIIGLVLSLIGGIIALQGGAGGFGFGLGALMCFGSVVIFTIGSRLTVTGFPDLTPLGRTTITLVGAAVASLIATAGQMALGGPVPDFGAFGAREIGMLLLFGVGSLAISQLMWIVAVGHLGIGLASLHINATPFYVMLILFAFGGVWNWMQAFAALVVAIGVLVAQGFFPLPRAVRP